MKRQPSFESTTSRVRVSNGSSLLLKTSGPPSRVASPVAVPIVQESIQAGLRAFILIFPLVRERECRIRASIVTHVKGVDSGRSSASPGSHPVVEYRYDDPP
jgi:hypothetical protein